MGDIMDRNVQSHGVSRKKSMVYGSWLWIVAGYNHLWITWYMVESILLRDQPVNYTTLNQYKPLSNINVNDYQPPMNTNFNHYLLNHVTHTFNAMGLTPWTYWHHCRLTVNPSIFQACCLRPPRDRCRRPWCLFLRWDHDDLTLHSPSTVITTSSVV